MMRRLAFLFFFLGLLYIPETQAQEIPFNTPEDHLRVATWNIKFLGRRTPLRTDKELAQLAERIKNLDFAVVALQEIQNNKRIHELVALLGSNWKVNPEAGWTPEQPQRNETCIIWDTSKVTCLKYHSWLEGYSYKNRPPFSGIFQPVKGGKPFVVISNHAYPGSSEKANQHRIKQGKFYRQLVVNMLKDPSYPKSIILVGDFNGEPGHSPHTTIQPENEANMLHLIGKSDNKGTMAKLISNDIDHIYATNDALSRIHNKISYVVRPKHFNESYTVFNQIYSDHLPVFVDITIFNK